MSMIYVWKDGSRLKGDPNIVGKELEGIQEQFGAISAEYVLDNAKQEESPLHQYFEWNDQEAAEEYRLVQARLIIRSVAVRFDRSEDDIITTRAFVEIKDNEAGPYMSLESVVFDDGMRHQLIEQAQRDILQFERKYETLVEIIEIIQPVKEKLQQLVNQAGKVGYGTVRPGKVGCGAVWQVRQVAVGLGMVRYGMVRFGRCGEVGRGQAGSGRSRHGMAGEVR